MRKILAKELKIKFIETLNELEGFTYEEGNPFLVKINSKSYFIFLKNLSPAYFKNSPDITRVQLPYSPHFSRIFNAAIPFIILGYDADNDTMVCWNPDKVKERLNARSNVSLYSRASIQSKVQANEFKSGRLSNGEIIIAFKRGLLTSLFDNINTLFDKSNIEYWDATASVANEPVADFVSGKLLELTDKPLLQEIRPLLRRNKVLEAVELCMRFYKGKYPEMSFKDWFRLVNNYYQKVTG
jgi:hypothetical protein